MTAEQARIPLNPSPKPDGDAVLACEAVLFDCDGVLVDSTAAGEYAWTQWATEYGLEPSRVLDGVHGRRSVETVALFIAAERRVEALARIEAIEIAGATRCAALPGAAGLIATFPSNRHWAIVTSASRALLSARLRAAGLPLPPVLITGEDVTRGKPAPDGYRMAAQRLGAPVTESVVIEDSLAGVQAGRAAGVRHVIGVGEQALQFAAQPVVTDLSGIRWTGTSLRFDGASITRLR
ncbi:HAD-IA family hydrolase [Streptomyces sp. NE06-03E]|uniref:HAD-IA family hydrolase n=1 Tax=unclassified Streptomyces TaxID=2593676 RepID=UPI0029A8B47A|nr:MULTISPECIES: HAD-IA family hydrolase [unclassified Streptomyces]MDX3054307.1 HAD-IA family hydrolase [Streptomyces sp. NE06-03E]